MRRTKSIRLSCTWQGDAGGKLYLFAEPKNVETCSQLEYDRFGGIGRLVWESPVVSHEATPLEMTFTPNDNEKYRLYHDTGTGDHLLHINMLCVEFTILDDCTSRTLEYTYKELLSNGALDSRRDDDASFQIRLLLAATAFLQCNAASQTLLHQFFQSQDLEVEKASLSCVLDLLTSLLEFKQRRQIDNTTVENEGNPPMLRMFSVM